MEVEYKGKVISINEDLLTEQDAWANLGDIVTTRAKIEDLIHLSEFVDTKSTAQKLLKELKSLEFDLQKYWGLPQDDRFHTYEWKLHGCTCPNIDNLDMARIGSSLRYVDGNCPYHWNEEGRNGEDN